MLDLKGLQSKRASELCLKHWHYTPVEQSGLIYCGNCKALYGEVLPGLLAKQYQLWINEAKKAGLVECRCDSCLGIYGKEKVKCTK